MPIDSDPIIIPKTPDDFASVIMDGVSSIEYRLILFLLIIFFVVASDVFINRILTKFKGAVDYKYPTNYGTFLQGLFLVLFFTIVDVGIKQKII